ncbi:MAG: sigma-70 family RNA polymerase sigma factor [Clostridia bacterium]|nr:sigma-70 family RNA polymerase sigma factor [Clostridia bacterium]
MEYKVDSYTLEYIEDEDKYYISFEDSAKQECRIEIEKEIFDIYMSSKKAYIKIKNETSRHLEHSLLSEVDIYKRAFEKSNNVVDIIMQKLESEKLQAALNKLTKEQRRRILLYYDYQLTMEEIALIEKCSKQSVQESIRWGMKKLKKF